MRTADKITTFMCQQSINSGSFKLLEPSWPVKATNGSALIKLKANWIGHMLRRNCLLQRVIEGKIKGGIEVTGRRGRRRRKLLDTHI